MANPYSKHLFLIAVILFFLDASVSLAARLSLPVELTVENGDYKNCTVHLIKNGEDAGTIPGKNILRIKLDFNSDYILAFSKPGYITKKIAVNTTVTAEREQQLFEPYKIGVKLFKQYEGINIVVYSQPVAKIKFNPVLDDFDYDVDYTKSILSRLEPIEHELEVRATEERKMIASGELPKGGFEITASSSERYAHFPNINGGKEILEEEKKPEDHSSYKIYPAQDPVDNATLNGGVDINNPATLNKGANPPPTIPVNTGDNQKNKSSNVEGINKPNGILNSDAEQDRSKTTSGSDNFDKPEKKETASASKTSLSNQLINNSGADNGNADAATYTSRISKTRDFIIEPNRTITTIKINDGQKAEIYRKVLYNWGGLFYFKNLSFSITQNLFELGTGEK